MNIKKEIKDTIIAIITHPIKVGLNYGCILQCYALQKMLFNKGYKNVIIDLRDKLKKKNSIHKILSVCVRLIKRNILNMRDYPHPFNQWSYTNVEESIICKNTLEFINKHIKISEQIIPGKNIHIDTSKYSAWIVGSDQVWRVWSSNNVWVPNFFLDFLKDSNVKRIAYAASFGVNENKYSEELLKICKPLAKKFEAISVREDSGVKLCKELFDVQATHVIDPTMFFDSDHYINLSKERNDYINDGDCFTYILDKNKEKQRIISRVCDKYNLKPFNIMPKSKFADVGPKHIEDCIIPPVEQWLDGFNKAKFVITDSFHGTVFSILFKKPFIVIGNAERGMARFESLLRMFHLEIRLIQSEKDLTEELLNSEIDYEAVYEILSKERKKAEEFLLKALS